MRTWQDFEYIMLATLPMFLFSATSFPLSTYPEPLQRVVQLSPLYHGAALVRELTTGALSVQSLLHVGVLVALGVAGLVVSGRLLEKLLLR